MSRRAHIYCVVAVSGQAGTTHHRRRTWGWFPTEKDAVDCIQHDAQFLHENAYYRWALIERMPAGLCQDSEVRGWFRLVGRRKGYRSNGHLDEWHAGRFFLCKPPKWAANICNWSMG
jgi:hypothetical protein